MVRGRQLDPALRARIFELRATGYGAKKIHKLLPDVPFNTIKTTLRRSKTSAAAGAGAAGARLRANAGSDDSPSPSPNLDAHRDLDVTAALAGHPLAAAAAGAGNPLAATAPPTRGLPGAVPSQQVPNALQQQKHQHHQQQHAHQQPQGAGPPLPRPVSNITPTLPGDPQTRAQARARDLLNEIMPPGAAGASPNGPPTGALDLERLKSEYRSMPEAARNAAEAELDMRKAALVTAKWEVQRDLEAARRQQQLEKLQALQQEGLDPETFYVRFRELVQPS